MNAVNGTWRRPRVAPGGLADKVRMALLVCAVAAPLSAEKLARAAGGRVVAWGRDAEGQCAVPSSATNIVGIAATAIQTLALREDGTLLAWGSPPPASSGKLVRIAGDNFHAAGVRSDGTVVVWSSFPSVATVPPEATNVVDVAVGNSHVLALRQNGRVIAWGENTWGQLNVPASATNVVQIDAGGVHGMALCADGRLLVWGQISYVPAAATNLMAIAATFDRCLALRRDGRVFEWFAYADLEVPPQATNVVAISGGASHWLAVRQDGKVVAWGLTPEPETIVPAGLADVTAIAAGGNHSVALLGSTAPSVFVAPPGATVLAGDPILLWGEPRGLRPVSRQWSLGGSAVPGTTNNWLFVDNVQGMHAGSYTLGASGGAGTVFSHSIELSVIETAPRFLGAERIVGLLRGEPLLLAPEVRGTQPMAFQWRKNGIGLAGETRPSLAIPAVTWADAGLYELVASNRIGVTVSPAQTLSMINVAAWGSNTAGPTEVPPSATNLVAIAAGVNHSLGLREDGTVLGWGDSSFGQARPPDAATNAVAIAAGEGLSLVLRADGRLIAWGSNESGQANPPADATNLIAVAAAWTHCLAARQDGKVFAWGANWAGEFTVPESASNVVAVAAGGGHSLALRADGTVVAWGSGSYGMSSVPEAATNVVAIAAGGEHNLALRADGTVVGWGSNAAGESTPPEWATNLVSISAHGCNSLGVRADGTIVEWGCGFYPEAPIPAQATNAIAVSAGRGFNLALLDRDVLRVSQAPRNPVTAAGETLILQAAAFGYPAPSYRWLRNGVPVAGATNAWLVLLNVQAGAAAQYSVESTSGGRVITSSPTPLTVLPTAPSITADPLSQVVLLGTKALFTAAAKGTEPIAFEWQFNGQTLPGANESVLRLSSVGHAQNGEYRVVAANALGRATSQVATLTVFEAVAWGSPWQGQTEVPLNATNLVELAAGTAHTLALREDGTVAAWGHNASGQCTVPPAATNVLHVAARGERSLALRRDGAVVTWGATGYDLETVPDSATNVIGIGAGTSHSLAVRRDGSVVAWGNNAAGQATVPATAANVVAVAGGANHSLALRADGTVVGWGTGVYGLTNPPAAATGIVAIACGSLHNLALRADGTVVAWGMTNQGQCNVPIEATNLLAIAAQETRSMGLRRDGRVFVWGSVANGMDQVPANATNVAAIALGAMHCVASIDRGVAVVYAPPLDNRALVGEKLILLADAYGANPPAARWYRNGQPVAGATNRWLVLPDVQESATGSYTVAFARGDDWINSAAAQVTVVPSMPVILSQPSSQTNWVGAQIALEVERLGSEPMHSAWFRNGTRVEGAAGRRLDFPDLSFADSGLYHLVLSNALGSATSNPVRLGVQQIAAWGSNFSNQTNVHSGATNVVALAAGDRHTLALRLDGSVVAWGASSSGLTNVPSMATNAIAIAAGTDHNLVARADGSVVAWGGSSYGKTTVPVQAAGVVAVAAGGSHSLALRRDGRVVAWGNTNNSLLNVSPRAVNVVRIAAPAFLGKYSLALRRDGRVFGWGENANGLTNPPAAISNVVGITAGPVHALAIRGDGRVVGWGSTTGGGLIIPESATNTVAVVAGANSTGLGFSLALRNDGAILGWGATSQVQLAQLPANLSSAFALGAGSSHAVAATASRAPRFVDRLGDLVAYEGRDFALNALVVGAPPLAYQWRFDGTDLAGATQPTLRLSNVTSASAGLYSVVVSNRLGMLEGEVAQLAVEPVPFAPAIVKSPASQTVWAGTNVTLSVEVTASPAPTFQWQRNGQDISGATGSTYTIPYAVPGHAGAYRVVVSNPEGTATSADALLTVDIPAWPTLKALEPNRVVSLGSPLLLTVTANGTPPIHYQWRLNGADLPGVTGPSLSLTAFEFEDGGVYSVVMSNASGVAESPGALIAPCPVAVWGTGPATNLPVSLSNAVAVAAGQAHALALKADGTVVAWGASNVQKWVVPPGIYVNAAYGQLDVPFGLTGVVAVAAGSFHNLALKSDGTLAAWGLNDAGQASVPAAATNVVAIAAGYAHSLALRADGSVLAWGTNQYGLTNVPATAVNVVAIAAGNSHCLALRADGVPVAWGSSASGATTVPASATDLVSVAAGMSFSLGVRRDGTRVQWGQAPSRYVYAGRITFIGPTIDDDYTGVAAGHNHALYLDSAGLVTVFTRGTATSWETVPPWFRHGVAVAAGAEFSLGLIRSAGALPSPQITTRRAYEGGTAVFAAFGPGQKVADCQWEFEGADQLGATRPFLVLSNTTGAATGTYAVRLSEAGGAARSDAMRLDVVPPPLPQVVRQPVAQTVGAGGEALFSVATAAGVPVSFAWQFNGTDMPGETRPVLYLAAVQDANAGVYRVMVRNAAGTVVSDGAALTVTATPPAIVTQPVDVGAMRGETVLLSVIARGSEPMAYRWEFNEVRKEGADASTLVLPAVQPSDVGGYRAIVTNLYGAATSTVARVYLPPVSVWGDRASYVGSPPLSASNLIALSVGGGHVLGLREDGRAVGWGMNDCGQASVPEGLSNVVQVSAGEWHSLALRSDGTVAGWGSTSYGGSVPEASLSNIVEVSAGAMFSLALDAGGNVYSWDKLENLQIEPVADAVAIAAGGVHRVALLRDGSVTAWGINPLGQTSVPAEATNAVAVTAGRGFSAALRADGLVVAWGTFEDSPSMVLDLRCDGNNTKWSGTAGERRLPVPAEATNVVAIAAGRHHLVALRADGAVLAWGDNTAGQTDVPSLEGGSTVAAGGDLSAVLHGELGARFAATLPERTVGDDASVLVNLARAGRPPFEQHWQHNGIVLPDQTSAYLWLPWGQVRAGQYRAEVSNGFGAGATLVSLVVTQAPPVVRVQPAPQTVEEGNDAVFTVTAGGSAPLTYRWRRDGMLLADGLGIEGTTTPVLTLRNVTSDKAGAYSVIVTNPLGNTTSADGALVVVPRLALAAALDTTDLVWTTGGDAPWRWQTLTTHDGVDAAASGPFDVARTNWIQTVVTGPVVIGFWWTTSGWYNDRLGLWVDGVEQMAIGNDIAWEWRTMAVPVGAHTLRWVHGCRPFSRISMAALDEVSFVEPEPPSVVTQPNSLSAIEGATATLSAAGAGTAPLYYQWLFNGASLPSATNAVLTLTGVGPDQVGDYRLVVANLAGSATSQVATLTLTPSAPVVVAAPQSLVTAPGLTAVLKADVRGTTAMDMQWQFNRADLAGARQATLEIPEVGAADVGWYRIVARNEWGTTFSAEAALTLVPVAAWGLNTYAQTSVPVDVGEVVEVDASYSGSLARRSDGSLRFWGLLHTYPPWPVDESEAAGPFVAASAGYDHFVALRADGEVVVWSLVDPELRDVPLDLGYVVAVDAGWHHNVALQSDGNAVAWGQNDEGQCTAPPGVTNLVAVAGGRAHSLGLRADGTVAAWGGNDHGQIDVPSDLTDVIAIDAGADYGLALRVDGTVAAWGGIVPPPSDIGYAVAVAAGADFALALRADGTVIRWGGDADVLEVPEGLSSVVSLAGGWWHALALVGDGRPVITVQPFHLAAPRDGSLTLHTRAVGLGPLQYQWQRDGVDLPEATAPTLSLAGAESELAGTYTVRVINALGAVESTPCRVGASPGPWFDTAPGAIRLDADGLHLVLRGLSGSGTVRVWATSDLQAWELVLTHAPVMGALDLVDPSALEWPVRFYRAIEARESVTRNPQP